MTKELRHFHKTAPFCIVDLSILSHCVLPPPPNKQQQQQQLSNKESYLSFRPGFLQLQTTLIRGWGDLQPLNKIGLYMNELVAGAHNLERATSMRSCHGVFTDPFIFRTVLMRILNIF